MNKDLYNREVELPNNLRKHLKTNFLKLKNAPKNSEGYKRNVELQDKKFVTYKQLKRIKNFFDNFKGNQKDTEFQLNGGFEMKNWVDSVLRQLRDGLKITKRNRMDTGMQNQFIKPHEKKDFTNVRPSKKHASTLEKYDAAVTESLKRINQIISKI